MRKAKENFYKKIKCLMFAILAISGLIFLGCIDSPEFLGVVMSVPILAWVTKSGEKKEYTQEDLDALTSDELAKVYIEHNKHKKEEIEELIKSKASNEDVKKLRLEFQKMKDEQFEEMKKALIAQGIELKKVKSKETDIKLSLREEFKSRLKEIGKDLYDKIQSGAKEPGFTPIKNKEGKTMSITSNVVSGQIPQASREPGIASLVRQAFTLRNGANVYGISSTLAEWVEQVAVTGTADMTAEGAEKSEISWTITVNDAKVKKITDYVKITEEMLNDVEGMMGEIDGNLKYQIELKEESQLLTGDGLTVNLNGIEKYAGPLDLAALAGTIAGPNNWDVLSAAITQIRVEGKGELIANRIFLNPVDIFLSIHASKSTTNDYVNPVTIVPAVSAGGIPTITVWGVPVIASDTITAGEYLVADMTKFTIRDYEQLRIQLGWESDDFIKNIVTIRGEKRLVSYAKTNHVDAFVTDTFADGKTLLEASS